MTAEVHIGWMEQNPAYRGAAAFFEGRRTYFVKASSILRIVPATTTKAVPARW